MKICIIGDVHFSQYSSIVRSRGEFFSTRLENMIKSLNWVEQVAKERGCVEEIFLGDFFDRSDLAPEEATALSEIDWNTTSRIRHFIVGNHESSVASLIYSSTKVLQFKNNVIEDKPYIYPLDDKTEILFLPYILEEDRKLLKDYLEQRDSSKKLLIVSHNDIKGVQMGKFISTTGFDVEDIEKNCDLYINGHLHNGSWITKKILNLGNLTGQNFNEDATKYEHHIAILDTDTFEIELIENPYAMNFYKIDINTIQEVEQLKYIKSNAVLHIKCLDILENEIRNILEDKNVIASKIVLTREMGADNQVELKFESADHLKQFIDFILSRDDLENLDIIKEELLEVCK